MTWDVPPTLTKKGKPMRGPVLALVLTVAACGDSGTNPEPTYETLSGTYVGGIAGVAQGVALDADLSITFNQTGGNLSGSYAIAGTLTEGVVVVDILGTGSIAGTVAAGLNPSVNVTLSNQCPNWSANFSGTFDSANNLLTISGPVDMLELDCTIFLTYPSVIFLAR